MGPRKDYSFAGTRTGDFYQPVSFFPLRLQRDKISTFLFILFLGDTLNFLLEHGVFYTFLKVLGLPTYIKFNGLNLSNNQETFKFRRLFHNNIMPLNINGDVLNCSVWLDLSVSIGKMKEQDEIILSKLLGIFIFLFFFSGNMFMNKGIRNSTWEVKMTWFLKFKRKLSIFPFIYNIQKSYMHFYYHTKSKSFH